MRKQLCLCSDVGLSWTLTLTSTLTLTAEIGSVVVDLVWSGDPETCEELELVLEVMEGASM